MLIGNGFTSQIIQDYSSLALMEKVRLLIPNEMKKIESIFNHFRITNTEINPYYYGTLPEGYDDDDDWAIGEHTPAYVEELFSPNLHSEICRILVEECNIKNSSTICQRLFIDAGLYYEMNKQEIVGIETPLKIVQIGIANGSISKQEARIIETTIKGVFFNNGNYHLPKKESCKGVMVDRIKAQKYFDKFSTIFTTNYDLVIDDLVHDKVKHLHGGFCFPNAYHKDYKHSDPEFYEIVIAADGKGKERQIYRAEETMFSKYLSSLETEDFDELHILGYSGVNDMHINGAIRSNELIKKVYVYVNPKDIKNEELRYHFGRIYRKDPNEIIYSHHKFGLTLLPWNEFWNQILV